MLALAPSLAELPFRGSRSYLHSTDLYPALTEFAKKQFSPSAFVENLTIRRAVTHQVQVNLDAPDRPCGSFCIRHGNERSKGWLVETDEPVRSRVPFHEETAILSATSGAKFARLEKLLPAYTTFELLVILTKMVAQQESASPWWICQIGFFSPLLEIVPLESRLKSRVSNRYLSMEIYQAGSLIGSASGIADIAGLPAKSTP
ncbi:MAG TPA: hypothetical protein VIW67_26120 [Terriglobales bacterium]